MNALVPESDFMSEIFDSIYSAHQWGMSREAAIRELNRAEIFAGLWDSQRGCLTEKVFQEGAAKRMYLGEPVAAGSTVAWQTYYDKHKAVKLFSDAILKYRDHLRHEHLRTNDSSVNAEPYARTFKMPYATAPDAFKNTFTK